MLVLSWNLLLASGIVNVDHINGFFEACGALFNAYNCWVLFKHKQVRGVSIWPSMFFTTWGLWNIVYYSALDQWYSWFGGLCLSAFSVLWLALAISYKLRSP